MNAQSNDARTSLPDFVPVIIIGAGPTGITAATMLGQYGISCLLLDRHESVYPLPRAVHADDEIYRILTRLGVGDEFAAHRRGALGLRMLDTDMRVLAQLERSPEPRAQRQRLPPDEHVRPTRVGRHDAGEPQKVSARRVAG